MSDTDQTKPSLEDPAANEGLAGFKARPLTNEQLADIMAGVEQECERLGQNPKGFRTCFGPYMISHLPGGDYLLEREGVAQAESCVNISQVAGLVAQYARQDGHPPEMIIGFPSMRQGL